MSDSRRVGSGVEGAVRESVDPSASSSPAPVPSLSAHLHASRLRMDTWNELQPAILRLSRGDEIDAMREEVTRKLSVLRPIEAYWAFPGREGFSTLERLFQREEYPEMARTVERIVRALASQSYRRRAIPLGDLQDWDEDEEARDALDSWGSPEEFSRPYFEILVVDQQSVSGEERLRQGLRSMRRPEDPFIYDVVLVPSFEDAIIAVLFNFNIQSVVVRYGFPFESRNELDELNRWLRAVDRSKLGGDRAIDRAEALATTIDELRPELDLYLVTDGSVEVTAGKTDSPFRRVFYRQEDYLELHLSIIRGVRERNRTPFFKALRRYAEQPTGVFHALPISRGKSIVRSNWIQDMIQFYGKNIFLAETSATSGGLDSLLDPHGPIKEAQERAARAFGARRSYFVTNGTTAANKIVVQAMVRPGDLVLVDRDCHKSHHYALTLAGAEVIYLEAYPLHEFSMYGGVPTSEVTGMLRRLEAAGKLDRVKMVILTNCTFDGIIYHPARVMEACLAIKPDLAFLWDEAWFAFARFSPTHRRRTAMYAAHLLRKRYRSPEYAMARATASDPDAMPDPSRVRVRVFATQSTHKTLTSLRQGSMIHVYDQDFQRIDGAFRDAYMTHTSTSPNYQVLASLDLGRRQAELEGYEMVGKQIELAMTLRETVASHPLLRRWFRFLTIRDLVKPEYRPSGVEAFYDLDRGWCPMLDSWEQDEFVLDPTRLTLYIGDTGVDGDTFKKTFLMGRHGIQVNKTTRNTCLFMTNIGTTRSSVAHLINALVRLAKDFEDRSEDESPYERRARERRTARLVDELPPLPDFSAFHAAFRAGDSSDTPEGDVRRAYFLGTDEDCCEYLRIDEPEIDEIMQGGRELVAASYLTPYPPGFPVLVPGQIVSADILAFLRALDTKEVHGYRPELGIRVFTEAALARSPKDEP